MAGFSTGTADNAGEWGSTIWHGSLVSGVRIAIGRTLIAEPEAISVNFVKMLPAHELRNSRQIGKEGTLRYA